jgi:hypothetical protein
LGIACKASQRWSSVMMTMTLGALAAPRHWLCGCDGDHAGGDQQQGREAPHVTLLLPCTPVHLTMHPPPDGEWTPPAGSGLLPARLPRSRRQGGAREPASREGPPYQRQPDRRHREPYEHRYPDARHERSVGRLQHLLLLRDAGGKGIARADDRRDGLRVGARDDLIDDACGTARRLRRWSPNVPPAMMNIAKVRLQAATTHRGADSPPPRSRWISGIATFTIAASRKIMNRPSPVASRVQRALSFVGDAAMAPTLSPRWTGLTGPARGTGRGLPLR